MSFEVRAGRESEYDEILDVTDAAFDDTPKKYFDNAWKNDPNFAPELHRVGVLDGRIVSAVRIAKKTMRVGCATVTLGGIADVSTHPDFRGRGYSTACLEDAIRFMEGNDFDLSMLFTGIHGFYRKLGWEIFPTYSETYEVNAESISEMQKRQGGDIRIDHFSKDHHIEGVSQVYDEFNKNRTGTICRGIEYYGKTLWRHYDPEGFFVALKDEKVVAYVRGEYGETANIVEYGTVEPGTAIGLLTALGHFVLKAADRGATSLRVVPVLSSGDPRPLSDGEDDEFDFLQIGWQGSLTHVYEHQGMMLRVVDLGRLFKRLLPELGKRLRHHILDRPMHFAFGMDGTVVGLHWDGNEVWLDDGSETASTLTLKPISLLQFLTCGSPVPSYLAQPWDSIQRIQVLFTWWPVDDF